MKLITLITHHCSHMEVVNLQTGHSTIARDPPKGATSCAVPVSLDQFAVCLNHDVRNSSHRRSIKIRKVCTCFGGGIGRNTVVLLRQGHFRTGAYHSPWSTSEKTAS